MTHAAPAPRSCGPDNVPTISANTPTDQAATRAAYIESLLADWPAPSQQQQRTIGSLLGTPSRPGMPIDVYRHWEVERHLLHTETPGKFGYFGTDEVAA